MCTKSNSSALEDAVVLDLTHFESGTVRTDALGGFGAAVIRPEFLYEHRQEIDAMISTWTRQRTRVEAMELPGDSGVSTRAVLITAELINNSYLQQRGTFVTIEHPLRGSVVIPGYAVRMSDSSALIQPAPALGRHTDEVLPDTEIEQWRKGSII